MGFRRRDLSGRLAVLGPVFLFLLMATFPGLIAPYPPETATRPYQPPAWDHLLGTNALGQDILSELLFAARTSLFLAISAALIATSLGVLVGLTAGYRRGRMDGFLMGLTDLFLLLPTLPLIILLAAYLGPGLGMMILIISLTAWPSTARVVRSGVLQMHDLGFVRSARALGAGPFYLMFRHILPNIREIVMAKGILAAAAAMATEAGVSFLGLSDPNAKSWGAMIHEAYTAGALVNGYIWWYLPPLLSISLAVLTLVAAAEKYDQGLGPFQAGRSGRRSVRQAARDCSGNRILRVTDLSVDFTDAAGNRQRALNQVSLALSPGEHVAVVGQTGGGKSVLLLSILGLLPGNASIAGAVCYRNEDMLSLSYRALAALRGRVFGYVPQGSGEAFNPVLSVASQVAETPRFCLRLGRVQSRQRAEAALKDLGFSPEEISGRRYAHRFSGGMIQRALLAAGMTGRAPILLVDEPTKGLDPELRDEFLRLLMSLEAETILLVTHDLGFAEKFGDRIAVLYASSIVEVAPADSLFEAPLHPYSKALLAAQPKRGLNIPWPAPSGSSEEIPGGCPFLSRCGEAGSRCNRMPPRVEVGGHEVWCWLYAP